MQEENTATSDTGMPSAESAPPPSDSAPAPVTIGTAGGLQIILDWDASVASAPAGFEAAVEGAAQFYVTTFSDPVTVTIEVGWGEITQDGATTAITDPGDAEGGPDSGNTFSYDQVLAALRANASSGADLQAVNSLASEAAPNGQIYVSAGEEKALGLLAGSASAAADGSVGFSAPPSDFTYDFNPNDRAISGEADFIGIAEHEIGHAMGRFSPLEGAGSPYYSILDLYRFAKPGTRELVGGQPAYFSIDGGATNLDNFDTTSDYADWTGQNGPDSYNAIYTIGVEDPVTPTDITEMNVLGYDVTGEGQRPPLLWVADTSGEIATVNPADGAVQLIGNAGVVLNDIAFGPGGRLFGVNGTGLYSVNTATGAASLVGDLGAGDDGMGALAFAPDGVLYGASSATDQLYEINTATGAATALSGNLPAPVGGDIVYDNGVLYMADANGSLDELTISGMSVTASVLFSLDGGVSGLAAGRNGVLYGAANDQLFLIDPSTGTVAPALSFTGQGLAAIEGATDPIPAAVSANVTGEEVSELLMTQSSTGELVLDEMAAGQLTYQPISGLGSEWQFEGSGQFSGAGADGFLLWDSNNGAIVVGTDTGLSAQYTLVGGVGPEWQFDGNAAFLGGNNDDFLLWNSGSGAIDVGAVVNGTAQYAAVGAVGPEWRFEGTGNLLGDGSADFLMWNSGNGAVVAGKIVNGSAQYTTVGAVGPEWQFEGTADFTGDGQDDFLMRNANSGALVIGEVKNGTAQYTDIGGVGPEWQFLGTGDFDGDSAAEFMMRNINSGALVLASVINGVAQFTTVGGVGAEWNFHTTNVATLA